MKASELAAILTDLAERYGNPEVRVLGNEETGHYELSNAVRYSEERGTAYIVHANTPAFEPWEASDTVVYQNGVRFTFEHDGKPNVDFSILAQRNGWTQEEQEEQEQAFAAHLRLQALLESLNEAAA